MENKTLDTNELKNKEKPLKQKYSWKLQLRL